jgi:hypothetical protein
MVSIFPFYSNIHEVGESHGKIRDRLWSTPRNFQRLESGTYEEKKLISLVVALAGEAGPGKPRCAERGLYSGGERHGGQLQRGARLLHHRRDHHHTRGAPRGSLKD